MVVEPTSKSVACDSDILLYNNRMLQLGTSLICNWRNLGKPYQLINLGHIQTLDLQDMYQEYCNLNIFCYMEMVL